MPKLLLVLIIILLFRARLKCFAEKILGRETDDFDFDGFPGAQHEFKFEIGGGKQECFFQNLAAGGTLHISFQVLRGGDGNIIFMLMKPDRNTFDILKSTDPSPKGYLEYGPDTESADYAICVDNTQSRMASKLVYIFIVTHLEEHYTWFTTERKDIRETMSNVTTLVQKVQESVSATVAHQVGSRMHVVRDWYLAIGNNTYIQRWSICQCVVVLISSACQVFFVRRLFRNYNTKTHP
ncbi:transmembrane emp24 domain-containing protein 5-like [Ruditapes philippinarum]|uniref:transmembrane emp24 domain-containing protein 5-like n=1 Tax=Ruditapes philippinarum TaxID=129788 RepID=UPI00295B75F3|nr:transmembrane emp24 domain-containing protein 5-like [Ruditapes philippinarum]